MDRGKRIIGVLLICISIGVLITWEKWGKEQLLYDDVVVCKENIRKGTVLEQHMLTTIKMDVKENGWISPREKDWLIGKEATSYVHKGMPLFKEYFDQAGLNASGQDGKYVLSVPEDWLDSAPYSLGRGDRAYFFSGSRYLTSAPVSAVNTEGRTIEVVVSKEQAAKLSGTAAAGNKLVIVYS